MTLPTTYLSALLVTIFSLACLGSWINTLKLPKKWRFELFYFDFAIGAFLAAVIAALTLGTLGADGFTFQDDLMRAGKRSMAFGLAAGTVFNLGNMLMVGASTLVGMSLAFPVALGMALLISSILAYVSRPQGNPTMVFTGLGLVVLAVAFAALTHRALALAKELERMKAGEHRTLRPSVPWKGIIVSLVAGILLGVYYPLVSAATTGETGVGPYSLAVMFTLGILFSSVVYNLYLMNLPLQGRPVEMPEYFRGRGGNHIPGWLGGIIWAAGMLACWVVASAPEEARSSPGTTFALLQSAPLVTALWGVFVWKEFKQGDARSAAYLSVTLFLFLAGLVMLALAPFSATP